MEFHGPFVFKWSMYDTLEPWGPLAGSVTISVGAFTEYSRMESEVIKSSRCHPDALRGSCSQAPLEKKARNSTARSDPFAGKIRQPSKAPAQALERMERRCAVSNGGSQAQCPSSDSHESIGPAIRSCSQAPYCSASQSTEEGAPASSADSEPQA